MTSNKCNKKIYTNKDKMQMIKFKMLRKLKILSMRKYITLYYIVSIKLSQNIYNTYYKQYYYIDYHL